MKSMLSVALAALALTPLEPALAAEPAPRPPVTPQASHPLVDAPGKNMVMVNLTLAPAGGPARPHRHPGSVLVYVTKGVARLGVEGQPVQTVAAGQTFFEAPGALHTVSESASPTEPAYAIAVMLVPDGAPLTVAEPPAR